MTRKIAVCDDDWTTRQQMADYLEQYQKEQSEQFQIFYFSSGEELLEHMPSDIFIVFLDIQMNGINGIDTAKILRKNGYNLHIIFITSRIEYALEGYEVHAYGFLRKPITYSSVFRHLKELTRRKSAQHSPILHLKNGADTDFLNCNSIIYAEVFHHSTYFILTDGSRKEYTIPLGEIESSTKEYGFFRCHKSYLVNMKHIVRFSLTSITMKNGDEIPVSKYRRKTFVSEFSKFSGVALP